MTRAGAAWGSRRWRPGGTSSSGPPCSPTSWGTRRFAVPEGWGLDSTPVLTEIALRTTRIQLASGVLSVWGRTPATLAMTAATLHQVSAGRYVLGLGASTRALAEGFHDVPFEHPAARLRDVVTTVRALLDGLPVQLAASRRRARCGWASRPFPGCRSGSPPSARTRSERGRRTRRRLDPRAGGPGLRRRLGGRAAARRRETAAPHAPAAHGGGRAHRRGGRGPGTARDIAAGLRRLVPERHGRRLRPVPGRPGLRRRGQRGHRREPASQPAARDHSARGPGRPRPARRLRYPRSGPGQLGPGTMADVVTFMLPPACPGAPSKRPWGRGPRA